MRRDRGNGRKWKSMIQGVSGDPEVLRASSLFTRFLSSQVSEESCSGSDGGADSDEVLREVLKFSSFCFAQHSMPGSLATSWASVDVLSPRLMSHALKEWEREIERQTRLQVQRCTLRLLLHPPRQPCHRFTMASLRSQGLCPYEVQRLERVDRNNVRRGRGRKCPAC